MQVRGACCVCDVQYGTVTYAWFTSFIEVLASGRGTLGVRGMATEAPMHSTTVLCIHKDNKVQLFLCSHDQLSIAIPCAIRVDSVVDCG